MLTTAEMQLQEGQQNAPKRAKTLGWGPESHRPSYAVGENEIAVKKSGEDKALGLILWMGTEETVVSGDPRIRLLEVELKEGSAWRTEIESRMLAQEDGPIRIARSAVETDCGPERLGPLEAKPGLRNTAHAPGHEADAARVHLRTSAEQAQGEARVIRQGTHSGRVKSQSLHMRPAEGRERAHHVSVTGEGFSQGEQRETPAGHAGLKQDEWVRPGQGPRGYSTFAKNGTNARPLGTGQGAIQALLKGPLGRSERSVAFFGCVTLSKLASPIRQDVFFDRDRHRPAFDRRVEQSDLYRTASCAGRVACRGPAP